MRQLLIGARLYTMGSKLGISFGLAYLGLNNILNDWGTTFGMVSFLILLMGIDIYNLTCRKLSTDRILAIREAVFNMISILVFYIILFEPLKSFVFQSILGFNASMSSLLVIVVMVEHLNQEVYRYSLALGLKGIATLNIFIRYGLWPGFLFITLAYTGQRIGSAVLFEILLIASITSLIVSLLLIHGNISNRIRARSFVRFLRIYILRMPHAIRSAFPFYISSVIVAMFFSLDKWLFSLSTSNANALSIYILASTSSFGAQNILDPIFFSTRLPRLLKARSQTSHEKFKIECMRFIRESTLLALVLMILSYLAYGLYVTFFTELEFSFLPSSIIFMAAFLFSVSTSWHYCLYACSKDAHLGNVTLISLSASLVFALLLSMSFLKIYSLYAMSFLFFGSQLYLKRFLYVNTIGKAL
jgi:hypothetical protein